MGLFKFFKGVFDRLKTYTIVLPMAHGGTNTSSIPAGVSRFGTASQPLVRSNGTSLIGSGQLVYWPGPMGSHSFTWLEMYGGGAGWRTYFELGTGDDVSILSLNGTNNSLSLNAPQSYGTSSSLGLQGYNNAIYLAGDSNSIVFYDITNTYGTAIQSATPTANTIINLLNTNGTLSVCPYTIQSLSGSTSGSATVVQVNSDTYHKKVIINLNGWDDTGTTITFDTAFSSPPLIRGTTYTTTGSPNPQYLLSGCGEGGTLYSNGTTLVLPDTHTSYGPLNGLIICEGY
jgi:hypothetical protein